MAQITGGAHRGHAAGDTDIEKAASQLVSDTKYKVRLEMEKKGGASRLSPAQVSQEYMKRIDASPAPGPVKAIAKKKLAGKLKEEHNIDGLASSTVANAMFKVFVEGIQEEEPEIELSYLNKLLEDTDTKKYKIVVTDKKTGNQYRRMATREKIAELRANPNIQSVEISSYGEPIGAEKNSGEQTAAVKSGKGLAKKDYDEDGSVESGAKEHAGAVHNAIQRKKGGTPDGKDTSNVKEAVEVPVAPAKRPTKGQNDAEIVSNEEKGMDNTKLINVFPELKLKETAYGKFLNMIQEKTLTGAETKKREEIVKSMKKSAGDFEKRYPGRGKEVMYATATKQAKKVAEETECDTEKKDDEKEVDPRSIPTKMNLLKNKLRSAGIKSPVFMMAAEETIDEAEEKIKGKLQSGTRTFTGIGYYGRTSKEKKDPKRMKRIFPGPKGDGESGDGDHPSLSAAERNPNLR